MSEGERTALREVVASADESLRSHAVAAPGAGELESRVPDEGRAFVVEAVREGFLLHYREPRAFEGMDDDLRLLAGDALYAMGLARLARDGDLEAVAELADLISLSAQAHAEGDPGRAAAIWDAGAAAVGTGSSRDHECAKAAWRGAQSPPA